MSEWWSYRLSDLILFSPDVYYRTFALYHHRIWPAHLGLLAGLVLAAIAIRRAHEPVTCGRIVTLLFAAAWIWCAFAFHLGSYSSINWAARYFAGAFTLQAIVLLWLGARGKVHLDPAAVRLGMIAVAIVLLTAPIAGLLTGRAWDQVELMALTPDPTAVATIVMLQLSRPRAARVALVIPVLWCLVGGLTLRALGSPEGFWTWLTAAAALAITAVNGKRARN